MKTLKLDIRGMTCGSCVRSVERALSSITDLTIKHLDKTGALVEVDDSVAGDALIDVIRGAGFDATVDATVDVAPLSPMRGAQEVTHAASPAGATGCGCSCGSR